MGVVDSSAAFFTADTKSFLDDLNNAAFDHLFDKMDEMERVMLTVAPQGVDATREVGVSRVLPSSPAIFCFLLRVAPSDF